jgi:hypothetical protein
MTNYYLTLNGTPVNVRAGSGSFSAPEEAGEAVRMYDNSLRTSVNPARRKRVGNFVTAEYTQAERDALVAIIGSTADIVVGGFAVSRTGGTMTAIAQLGEEQHVADGDDDVLYSIAFSLHEV